MVSVKDIKAAVREAEGAGNGPNGFTSLHFRKTPVDFLVSQGLIGPIELQAAHEFSWIFEDITRDLHSRSVNHDYATKQKSENHKPATQNEMDGWKNYKAFASCWSNRRKRNRDLTLAILVAAAIDQHPIEHIAEDHNISEEKARDVIIRALRDYAARAGWVDSRTAAEWFESALKSFPNKDITSCSPAALLVPPSQRPVFRIHEVPSGFDSEGV